MKFPRIVFAIFFLLPLVSMAGETAAKSYYMPIYNGYRTLYARIGLQTQTSEACTIDVKVEQIYGYENPVARIIASHQIIDMVREETGASFQIMIHLFSEYKTTVGQLKIGSIAAQCHVSCNGELSCEKSL